MRTLWLIPISLVAVGAGLLLRARRRRSVDAALTTGPVSADWLAQARGHEEQEW
jgi:cytochrome c-type biogenesis protein CcmH/NrfF